MSLFWYVPEAYIISIIYDEDVAKAIEILIAFMYLQRTNLIEGIMERWPMIGSVFRSYRTRLRKSLLMRMKLEIKKYMRWKAERYRQKSSPEGRKNTKNCVSQRQVGRCAPNTSKEYRIKRHNIRQNYKSL